MEVELLKKVTEMMKGGLNKMIETKRGAVSTVCRFFLIGFFIFFVICAMGLAEGYSEYLDLHSIEEKADFRNIDCIFVIVLLIVLIVLIFVYFFSLPSGVEKEPSFDVIWEAKRGGYSDGTRRY